MNDKTARREISVKFTLLASRSSRAIRSGSSLFAPVKVRAWTDKKKKEKRSSAAQGTIVIPRAACVP